jgi:Zn-dependent membrane protease YugP
MKNLVLAAMFVAVVTTAGCFNKTEEVAVDTVATGAEVTTEVVAPAVMPEVTVEAATGTDTAVVTTEVATGTTPTTGN